MSRQRSLANSHEFEEFELILAESENPDGLANISIRSQPSILVPLPLQKQQLVCNPDLTEDHPDVARAKELLSLSIPKKAPVTPPVPRIKCEAVADSPVESCPERRLEEECAQLPVFADGPAHPDLGCKYNTVS